MSGADSQAPPGTQLIRSNVWFDGNVQVRPGAILTTQAIGLSNTQQPQFVEPNAGAFIYSINGGTYTRDSLGNVWPVASPATNGGVITGAITQTLPTSQTSSSAAPPNGTLVVATCFISAGSTIGHIGFVTGTQTASGQTHWWAVVLDATYHLRAHSADQLTAVPASSTWFSLAMVTPYMATYSGNFHLGLMFANTAGANPNIISGPIPLPAMVTGANAVTPVTGGLSSTGLTTPGTDGTTVYIAPTASTSIPFLYAAG